MTESSLATSTGLADPSRADEPALTVRVWVHAIFLTAWFVMFWLQATLVARRRVAWHRQAGSLA